MKLSLSRVCLRLCILTLCSATSMVCSVTQAAELGDFYNLGPRPAETAIRVGAVALTGQRYQGSREQKV